jgi:hypothetical protein
MKNISIKILKKRFMNDNFNTTYSVNESKPLNLNDMVEAIKTIKPIKKQRIEVSIKHYKLLNKVLTEAIPARINLFDNLACMYGIPITIKKYLKKVRLYTEN